MVPDERPRKLLKTEHERACGNEDDEVTPLNNKTMLDESLGNPEEPLLLNDLDQTVLLSECTANKEKCDAAASTPTLSKNQQKKLKKIERWEAGREWRKEQRKEKLRAKRECARMAKDQVVPEGSSKLPNQRESGRPTGRITLRDLRKKDNGRSFLLPVTFILDCDFDDLMLDKERKSLASQITRSYSDNARAKYRAHIVVSSFNKLLKERFDNVLARQYERWKGITITEDNFVEAVEPATARMKQPRGGRLAGVFAQKAGREQLELEEEGEVIYLTSDSPDTLTELKPYSTYIIGGLVDKNRHKGICYKRATEKGLKTAKLPIGEYMQMSSRYVLATNHVVEIMVKWLELGDWGQAFDSVIPKRKGATLKDDGKKDNGTVNDAGETEESIAAEEAESTTPTGETSIECSKDELAA